MSDLIFQYLATHGYWALALTTFLSCLALPVPASIAMLVAGGLVAAGDLGAVATLSAAFTGAVSGDTLGYGIARTHGHRARRLMARSAGTLSLFDKSLEDIQRRGPALVFLSRWLMSPLGPYVNVAAGVAGLGWRGFLLADIAGEAVWVALYVGLGAAFVESIALIADLTGNLSGLLAALGIAGAAGLWLMRALRNRDNSG